MMGINFKSKSGKSGVKALEKAINNYQKELSKENVRRMEQASIFVEGEAKRNIKKIKSKEGKLIDTGRMLNSITHEVDTKGNKVRGFVGTNVFYAKYQELGTQNIPPRPFLRPALLFNRKEVKEILKNGLNSATRKVDKK
ncbi:MAG: hypothetical protein FH761_16615 [Firmicutes bacterium]|nr:hypothetical protein [Bacillota bacterium]